MSLGFSSAERSVRGAADAHHAANGESKSRRPLERKAQIAYRDLMIESDISGTTRRLYFEDPYRTGFEAEVVEKSVRDEHPAVVLAETCFYPESGGQPADKGTLNGTEVLDVRDESGRIVHVLAKDLDGTRVRGEIDGRTRFERMQQHTGQHILSQVFVEILSGETRSFHMGDDVSTLEIGIGTVSDEDVDRVEDRANAVVFENRDVKTYWVDENDVDRVPLRRPPKKSGTLRIVEVDGFDFSACGGTHCRRTGEVGLIKIPGWEKIRGNVRFRFVCGFRALRDYAEKTRGLRRVAGLFSTSESEAPDCVVKALDEAKEAKKALRRLEDGLAAFEARDMCAESDGPVVRAAFSDKSPEAVRALALNIIRGGGHAAVLGLASRDVARLWLAAPESLGLDVRKAVPAVAAVVPVKGGGRSSLVELVLEDARFLEKALDAAAAELLKFLYS
ncbi:MAG: alanine--tRNA ligase-related protein [Acidobacteriota bacterium]|nr:alanine--tRNA ligase-related protein [Acidobacteriota bacterium]